MIFLGTNTSTVDEKNRVRIPAKTFSQLTGKEDGEATARIVVTISPNFCLALYAEESYDTEFAPRLIRLPDSNTEARRLKRMLMARASRIETDKHGRFVLAPELAGYAGIDKDNKNISIIGVGDHIEIWRTDLYERYLDGQTISVDGESDVASAWDALEKYGI